MAQAAADAQQPPDAAARRCMNCGAAVTGAFCPSCGQKDDDVRRPVWTFIGNFFDDVLSLESRLWRTLITLMVLPGIMTRHYLEGRRQSYTPPLRLYLVTSLFFFLSLGLTDIVLIGFTLKAGDPGAQSAPVDPTVADPTVADPTAADVTAADVTAADPTVAESASAATGQEAASEDPAAPDPANASDRSSIKTEISIDRDSLSDKEADQVESVMQTLAATFEHCGLETHVFAPAARVKAHDPSCHDELAEKIQQAAMPGRLSFLERLIRNFQMALDEPARMNKAFNTWLPRAMVLVLPMMALCLKMVHWNRKQYLINQLIFSLHFHTFLFALLICLVLWAWAVGPLPGASWIVGLLFVYLLVAMKLCYRQGWPKTVFKAVVVASLHSGLLITAFAGIAVFGLGTL